MSVSPPSRNHRRKHSGSRAIKAIAVAAFLGCSFLFLQGRLEASVTVNYTAQSGQRNVLDSGGNLIPEGQEVRIGFFDPGFDIDGNAGDLAALDDAWNPFDSTTIRAVQNLPSRFSATSPGLCDSQFNSKPIHLWILMTEDGSPPLPDYSNVSEYGVFASSAGSWFFPLHNSPPGLNTTQINSNQVDHVEGGQGLIEAMSLRLLPNPNPPTLSYDLWAQSSFPAETPGSDRLREADPDCDGINNLLEFYSGTDPLEADSAEDGIRIEEGNAVFTFRRSKRVDASMGVVQTSPDLINWQISPLEPEVITDFETHEVLQVTFPPAPSGKAFIRLRVED